MKVYALVGKSGTGKSFQAVNLCRQRNIESIIDDGLFICRNKVIAGTSAKRQKTKVGAVKAAMFYDDSHMEEVSSAIQRMKPRNILVLGTSDTMVERIAKRIQLPEIEERIYIEDITTQDERDIAKKQRNELGKHVIPVPMFQLKRQFSGYFMAPMRVWRRGFGFSRVVSEKSVVRPTYSYLGDYEISPKVIQDIAECVKRECDGVSKIHKVAVFPTQEGVEIYLSLDLRYGVNLFETAGLYQENTAKKIEEMTAFNVNKLELEVRGIQ